MSPEEQIFFYNPVLEEVKNSLKLFSTHRAWGSYRKNHLFIKQYLSRSGMGLSP